MTGRLTQLLSSTGVEEELILRTPRIGVMAFHGGSLERMTDVIARAAADRSGASYYGITQPDTLRWHVPSREFDPAESTRLASFLDHVDTAIAVHGYGRPDMFTTILLGGSNRELADRLAAELRGRLDDYEIVDDLDMIPEELRGLHPDNPVNRCRLGGVQIELPPRPRGLGPYWEHPDADPPGADGLRSHTEALVRALAAICAGRASRS